MLTDSGGLQEETSALGVPCLTMRENTERPSTVALGTSRLVGNDEDRITEGFRDVVSSRWPQGPGDPALGWPGWRPGRRRARGVAPRRDARGLSFSVSGTRPAS